MKHAYRCSRTGMAKFADVITYMDILAKQYDINLGDAVADKFNEVSKRVSVNVTIEPAEEDAAGVWLPPMLPSARVVK